ncbi:MAG: hypothetical protein AB1505_05865 [Candidatus Latescibacterota bacterium]
MSQVKCSEGSDPVGNGAPTALVQRGDELAAGVAALLARRGTSESRA